MDHDFNNIISLLKIIPYPAISIDDVVGDNDLVDSEDKLMAKWVHKFGSERYLSFYKNSKEFVDQYRKVNYSDKCRFIDAEFHNYEAMMNYFKK